MPSPKPRRSAASASHPPTVPHPINDVPLNFSPATSLQVRGDLGDLIRRDLMGPWDEDEAEQLAFHSEGPVNRYLVGRLGPRPAANADTATGATARTARDAATTGEDEPAEGQHPDPELPERMTVQAAGRLWASSMGMSFVVAASVGMLTVTASWGRYALAPERRPDHTPHHVPAATAATAAAAEPDGELPVAARQVWTRTPVTRTLDVDITTLGNRVERLEDGLLPDFNDIRADTPAPTDLDMRVHTPYSPGIDLEITVRRRPHQSAGGEDLRIVELALVNRLPEHTPERRDTSWLFQAELTAVAASYLEDDNSPAPAVFLPLDDPTDPTHSAALPPTPAAAEERRLRLLYRDSLRHARGRNVAVQAAVRKGERRAHRLTTTWLPEYDVPGTTAPTTTEQPLLTGIELGMDELAELAIPSRRAELTKALGPLADGYHTWLDQQRTRLDTLPPDLRPTAEAAIEQADEICRRITLGIDTLAWDDNALLAFRFANRAMALQRHNTDITTARAGREHDPASYAAARSRILDDPDTRKAGASWRPFQLAFVLLNLASLADPGHPHRSATGPQAIVDLLFFPTGGGKTEAYLGLAAFTFALRRLQGVLGSGEDARSGADGIGVLMRYTLRLLTAQQFQRAAALLAAAEVLRREAVDGGDERWGRTPFRIGLWVGSAVSPNWFEQAKEQIGGATENASDRYAPVIQVLNCPWCGTSLTAHRNMEADDTRRRVLLYCPRGEGPDRCPFSRLGSPGEGIPVLTVDEEIYRLTPAMVIATVDKLAQLPWKGYAGMLFGRVTQWCDRHGYRHSDLDARTGCGSRHNKKGQAPAVTSRPVTRLRPPDLVIQDELHLISGSLGTTVGLFESAVDQLCGWEWTDTAGHRHSTGPKIVASTATTKRAAEQVRRVFAREVAVFPPQVLDVGDTFFSRQVEISPKQPGRRYLGICAHGTRLKAAEIRIAEIMLLGAQELFDRHGSPADPYMTLVGYFNATRELAGMRRAVDDDVTTRVRINGGRKGRAAIANRLGRRSGMLRVQELTSRVSSAQIGAALKKLEVGFNPELSTSVRRDALYAEFREAATSKRPSRVEPKDSVDEAVDVLLATSMLQVGVDVSRFGLMLVVGQPKNTAEYIQASSRVGRDPRRPGLVVTLYNWSRPRDLAHYEDFAHYHATFYRQVEALSVTPFTRRSLDRGTAATYIAALRQAVPANSHNLDADSVDLNGPTAAAVEQRMLERAERADGPRAARFLKERIDRLKDKWAEARTGSGSLAYTKVSDPQSSITALLHRADGSRWTELTVPMSMRETENEINLLLPGGDPASDGPVGGPAWRFGPAPDDASGDGPAADSPVDTDEYGTLPGDPGKDQR